LQTVPRRSTPVDGDSKPCPQCRKTLVFNSRYPVLTVGMALVASNAERGDRIRYARAWVCGNDACDYRDIEEDSY
jgi:hypothetical protein